MPGLRGTTEMAEPLRVRKLRRCLNYLYWTGDIYKDPARMEAYTIVVEAFRACYYKKFRVAA